MRPIIYIKEGLLVNLVVIVFLLSLEVLAAWLDKYSHGHVSIFVWMWCALMTLGCYFPIDAIRNPKSRSLEIEGGYLIWHIRYKEGGPVQEERIPLRELCALEFVIPREAGVRNSKLISCAELYFVTTDGQKHELPLEFFPGVYRDRIVAAIRQGVPEIQVVEKVESAA
jgi:hypothetical protein